MIGYCKDKLEFIKSVFEHAEKYLSEFNFNKNYLTPNLVKSVALDLKISGDQISEVSQLIRLYVKSHPKYYSSRGRNGGIMLRSKLDEKISAKELRKQSKIEFSIKLDEKIKNMEVKKPLKEDDIVDIDFDKMIEAE